MLNDRGEADPHRTRSFPPNAPLPPASFEANAGVVIPLGSIMRWARGRIIYGASPGPSHNVWCGRGSSCQVSPEGKPPNVPIRSAFPADQDEDFADSGTIEGRNYFSEMHEINFCSMVYEFGGIQKHDWFERYLFL